MKSAMEGMLEPTEEEKIVGNVRGEGSLQNIKDWNNCWLLCY